jgi:predicted polyphosphate/ATP-dependent NAD kinase
VRAQQLIGETTNPDTRQYLKMLYDSSANLLSFAGFTTRAIFEAVTKQKQAHLELAKF